MVLAIGSLLAHASQRLRIRPAMQAMVCPLLLACLCGATLLRAHDWRSKLDIARVATEGAPASGRAWTQLCASRFDAGGGAIPGNPLLDEAIATCSKGADAAPNSLNTLPPLVVLHTPPSPRGPHAWQRPPHHPP